MVDGWSEALADAAAWRHLFGSPESPVVVAALDERTLAVCSAIRSLCRGERTSVFTVGPSGGGKSLFLSAALAEADENGIVALTVSPTSQPETMMRDLGRGEVQLLAVHRFDELGQGVRNSIVENRARASAGVFATAQRLPAAAESALTNDDMVLVLPALEERPRDVVAIAQLFWPQACGVESDLAANCSPAAIDSLCRGPHADGVTSLREAIGRLATALITAGVLNEGRFLRPVEAYDINEALLAAMRERVYGTAEARTAAVIVVEGDTDVVYLRAAAERAAEAWDWDLLAGCEVRAAGQARGGGADAVWPRLLELRANSVDCVGLFDNDKSGRQSAKQAGVRSLPSELLPEHFDRLRLDDEERALEIEDLVNIRVLDAFYQCHPHLAPEDVRWRSGAWRVVPRGADKDVVTGWVTKNMTLHDCERLVYVLCLLRRRLGMPIPRSDLDAWRRELMSRDEQAPAVVLSRLAGGSTATG
jgi:hypothetical protein